MNQSDGGLDCTKAIEAGAVLDAGHRIGIGT
jgi:hypothetical protein